MLALVFEKCLLLAGSTSPGSQLPSALFAYDFPAAAGPQSTKWAHFAPAHPVWLAAAMSGKTQFV